MTSETRRSITPAAERDPRRFHAALCQDIPDPDLFFPNGSSPEGKAQAEEARRICLNCPVRSECLNWALKTAEPFGVAGGLTEEERRALLSSRRGARTRWRVAAARCWESVDQINRWRAEGVPQREMARRLGLSRDVVGDWIRENDPTTKELAA